MTRTPKRRRPDALTRLAALALVTAGLAAGAAPAPPDSWDAVYLAGAKIGHIHTYIEPVTDRGRELMRVRVDTVLTFRRDKDRVTQKLQYGTVETPTGEVLRLDTRTLASGHELRVYGDAIGGKMVLKIEGTGKNQEQTIPWGPDVRGPYAAEQSLSRQPIKAGEIRELKMFVPELNRVCDVTLKAETPEEVTLGGGVARSLLRVEQSTLLDGQRRPEYDVTLWVDAGGQVLKSKADIMGGMVIFRTTKDGAVSPSDDAPAFDQIANSVIRVKQKINRPEQTRDVTYRITLKNDDPAKVLPADRRQSLRPGSKPNEALLDVKSAGADSGEPASGFAEPVYLRPSAMVNSEDSRVMDHARLAVGAATDQWEKAKRIEHWVAQNLKDKNFSVTFASASEVARDLSGDCTEHGVLVAAMCRAEGVPARVVVGLIYVEHLGGFGFHLWNEVYVNRRWVAVDAAWDQSTVDAVHIKLADASLDGVSPFEAFLPVARVFGKMTIDPVEIR